MAQERKSRPQDNGRYDDRPRPQRRRSSGRAMGFAMMYVIVVIGVSALLACLGWIAANDVLALNKAYKEETVTITQEMIREDGTADVGQVSRLLKEKGLIQYRGLFSLFSSLTHGKNKIIAGSFTLNTDMDYRALISGMSWSSSSKAKVNVTIPEGYTVAQIFQLLEDSNVASVEDLNEMAADHDYAFSFLQDIPLGDPSRLEGYLFPDTYEFTTPHSALYVINKMLVRFDEVFTDEMRAQVEKSGKTIHEVLTVASLIERETDGTDQKRIASVIYNRLNDPTAETVGLLQIDATLTYINGGRVPVEADKQIDSPYNTYKYKGLPPGPIASPGLKAIQAAMDPEKTSYFYYVLGDDNVHHFFKTYSEMQSFMATQKRY